MGCSGQSSNADDEVSNGDYGKKYAKRQHKKQYPTITYFDLYGRGSALHFQFEYAGQSYNEDLMTNWEERKKDFNGCGLPVVTLPDGTQLAESIPTTIYFGKLFG